MIGRSRIQSLTVQKTAADALENDEAVFHFRTDEGGWSFA
jgi:hypothetical protein